MRLVLPGRPGCGRSDARSEASLLDWAREVEELADEPGFGRFAVFGVSAGHSIDYRHIDEILADLAGALR